MYQHAPLKKDNPGSGDHLENKKRGGCSLPAVPVLQSGPVQKKQNDTGLPDNLKEGVEGLSGLPMDDVQVHYNSARPAGLQALAYAQGTDIHVGPGQEKHLPHEAWHVVQQKQGRVQPTVQQKSGASINDDAALEEEADIMGGRALTATVSRPDENGQAGRPGTFMPFTPVQNLPVQKQVIQLLGNIDDELRDAETAKTQIQASITAGQHAQAVEAYKALKEKMKEIYLEQQANRAANIFNRHTNAIDGIVRAVIASFREAWESKMNSYQNDYRNLYDDYEGNFNNLSDKIAAKLVAGEDVETLKRELSEMAERHKTGFSNKNKEVTAFNALIKQNTENDSDVTYGDKGRLAVNGTKLTAVFTGGLKEYGLLNRSLAERFASYDKEINRTMEEPQNETLRNNTALLLLAGTKDRLDVVAGVPGMVTTNLGRIFTGINTHHRADNINDVALLIKDAGEGNLDVALALIGQVGPKGKIGEIRHFYEVSGALKGGPPGFSAVTAFLQQIEYASLAAVTLFVQELGRYGSLGEIQPLWTQAEANKKTDEVIQFFKGGVFPHDLEPDFIEIGKAFAGRKGNSTIADWTKLLQVPGWSAQELVRLAVAFDANPGNVTTDRWVAAASKDATLKTKPDEARAAARLDNFAGDQWYGKQKSDKLSSPGRARKKYTQLLYALLGNTKLDGLGNISFDNIKGDFLSMLVFFHRHIASFQSNKGQGFDREDVGGGKYARSDADHPLNQQYKGLLSNQAVDVSKLLQPVNSSLLDLQKRGQTSNRGGVTSTGLGGTTYSTGGMSVASAGLPSHNLKILHDQQHIIDASAKKKEGKEALFNAPVHGVAPPGSRELDGKALITDSLLEKQKAALAGKTGPDAPGGNFHDGMLADRSKMVNNLSTAINSISGGSQVMYAISSENHPSLILLVPKRNGRCVYKNNTTHRSTGDLVPEMATDFNNAPGQEVKITVRGSFGFQRPTIADTSESVRIWPGYAPVEALLPGLKVLVENLNSKRPARAPSDLTNIGNLTGLRTDLTQPVIHVEALKAAMRHAFIALNKKIDGGAPDEKKRVYEWLKTRLLIKLQQSEILLDKATHLFDATSTASQQEKNKHYMVTADMTDKLQEYTMLYTAATLEPGTENPNRDHTKPGKFKDTGDPYNSNVVSQLGAADYRVFYLDSGEQALITAGILANRFHQKADESSLNVPSSNYISRNPYFEVGIFKGDERSNLQHLENGHTRIVHADLSPVITGGRTGPKPANEIQSEVKGTWQRNDGSVGKPDMIPIIDITNSSMQGVVDLGSMPDNFIIVESLTKHQQLGADKFIMGRLIAVSNKEGTKGVGPLVKTNFLDLAQKIVGPVSNEAYNPLLTQVRSNMDKALYTDELV